MYLGISDYPEASKGKFKVSGIQSKMARHAKEWQKDKPQERKDQSMENDQALTTELAEKK